MNKNKYSRQRMEVIKRLGEAESVTKPSFCSPILQCTKQSFCVMQYNKELYFYDAV
jgi:hypothetical protein